MGYMRHHMMVVTTFDHKYALRARVQFTNISHKFDWGSHNPMEATSIVTSEVNGYHSFFIPTDGSKEGWTESETGESVRAEFITWLKSEVYDDGSSPYDWAHVQYGDEDDENMMLDESRHEGEE